MIQLLEKRRHQLVKLCEKFKVKNFYVFGSAAIQGKFNPRHSDIDFLVEFEEMDAAEHAECYFSLLEHLQDLFHRRIDLVEINAVANPYLRRSIAKTKIKLYAA